MYTTQQLQRYGSAHWYLEMVSGGGEVVVEMRREEMWEQEEKGAVRVWKREVVCSSSWVHLPLGESGEAAGHLGRTEHLMRMHVSVWASLPQLLPHRLTLGFSDSKRLYLILLCLYPFYLHFTKYSSMGGRGRKLCRAEVETRQSFGTEK